MPFIIFTVIAFGILLLLSNYNVTIDFIGGDVLVWYDRKDERKYFSFKEFFTK